MFSNISKRFNIPVTAVLVFLLNISVSLKEQDSSTTRPRVIKKLQEYYEQVRDDSSKQMVELKKMIPRLQYDLRYATANNFMHRRMYPGNTTCAFLRLPAAKALKEVQEE